MADGALRARMGSAGRLRVERDFHPAVQMGKVLSLCLEETGEEER